MSLQASSSTRPTTDSTDNSTRANYVATRTIPLSLRDLIFQREVIHAVLQTLGALCFCVGSIFFLPALEHYFTVGLWLYLAGFVAFIAVSTHELSRGFSFVSFAYLVGSIVFGTGCILFLPSIALATAGAWCFVVGSVGFSVGALGMLFSISANQSSTAFFWDQLATCSNLIGAILYLTGSLPYLHTFESLVDQDFSFLLAALEFLVGSILFSMAGFTSINQAIMSNSAGFKTERRAQKGQLGFEELSGTYVRNSHADSSILESVKK